MSLLFPPEFAWVGEALLTVLALGLLAAALVGALLVGRPHTLLALNVRLSRWIDTSAHFHALEKPRHWERFFYRHHRLLGGLIVIGALYVLARWAFAYERQALLAALGPRVVQRGYDAFVVAGEVAITVLHVGVLAVGLVVLFRPSLLKSVERTANRWHTVPSSSALDRVMDPVDRSFAVYPRLLGFVVLVAALGCLASLYPYLPLVSHR